MKKIKLTVIKLPFVVFCAFLLTSSCKKNSDESTMNSGESLTIAELKASGWNSPSLSIGEHMSGQKHNLYLEQVAKVKKHDMGNRPMKELLEIFQNQYPDIYKATAKNLGVDKKGDVLLSMESILKHCQISNLQFNRNPMQVLNSTCKGVSNDSLINQVYNELVNTSMNSMGRLSGIATSPNFDIDIARVDFESISTGIKTSRFFSPQQKMALIEAVDVTFYSQLFWTDVMMDPTNSWHNIILYEVPGNFEDYFGFPETNVVNYAKLRKLNKSWWKFLVVGIADVAGAVLGGALGGFPGAIAVGAVASGAANDLTN